jgi:beta-galactosidase
VPVSGKLVLDQLHDYALIFANGKLIGKLDRRLKQQNSLDMNITERNTQLDILVENTGRINFSRALLGERQGITHQVTLNGTPVTGWQIYSLPMHDPAKLSFRKEACTGPCFYRGGFKLDKTGDTFLDTEAFTKGFVWINGHELGRVWNIGPQKALYVPGSWLKHGKNEVVVFDLDGGDGKTLYGRDKPLLDAQPSH